MTTIRVHADAPVPPERILGALTDFTDHRPAYWPNLDPNLFRVHALGDTWAEVTEGAAFAGGSSSCAQQRGCTAMTRRWSR